MSDGQTESAPGRQLPGLVRRMTVRLRYTGWRYAAHAILIVLGIANIYPFLWMIGTSLKSTSEAGTERTRVVPQLKYWLREGATEESIAPDAPDAPEGLNARQRQLLRQLLYEDKKRREGTATFIATRISAAEYARKFGKLDFREEEASEELRELQGQGLLESGRTVPENYGVVWADMNFYLHFLTSVVLTLAVVFLTVLLTSLFGYALARIRFPGKTFVALLFIGCIAAPRDGTFIPIFRMLRSFGMLEGLIGIVLWLTNMGMANSLLMAGFFLTLPKEVEEAAAMDGAGTFRTFFHIAFPMARPIVVTVGLFAFLRAWNQFLIPLICTMSRPNMQPLSVAVFNFQKGHVGLWAQTNAAAAIMIVPLILIFVLLQQHIVRSIAVGAVKG